MSSLPLVIKNTFLHFSSVPPWAPPLRSRSVDSLPLHPQAGSVVLKNIPPLLGKQLLWDELSAMGFDVARIDMPRGKDGSCNRCYCFIHLRDPHSVSRLIACLHGRWLTSSNERTCRILMAHYGCWLARPLHCERAVVQKTYMYD
jgi:hypothetical protein